MTILVADDHYAVREGLKTILNSESLQVSIVGEASLLKQVREFLARTPVDLVLLDINFPDGNGLDLVREASGRPGSPRFLVLSMYREGSFVLKALQAGAWGFVGKDSAGDTLRHALEALRQDNVYLDRDSLDALAGQLRTLPTAVVENEAVLSMLSSREREVFQYLIRGSNSKTIAAELSLSTKTVDNHKSAVFMKLQVDGLADLLRFANEHKLL